MPDNYLQQLNDTSVALKLKILDNGDGTFSYCEGRYALVAAPADQATVSNVFTDHIGSTLDTLHAYSVSYNIKNVGANSITWQVIASNLPDFSDGPVVVKAGAAVAAAATDTYSSGPAVYRYYKVQIEDTVNLSHGTSHLAGITKG